MSRSVSPFLLTRLLPAVAALALMSLPAQAEPLVAPLPLDPPALPAGSHAPALTVASVDADTAPLTLPQAWARAWTANPDLQAARHEVDAAAGAVLQAGAPPNPSLDLAVEDQRRQTRETTVLLSQPLELGNKRAARRQAAQGEQGVADATLQAQQASLQASVTTRFFAVLAAQERWKLAQEATALAARARQATARQVALGKLSPMVEAQADVDEANVQLQLQQAGNDLATTRRQLAATWNAPVADFAHAQGRLDVPPVLPDLEQLLALLPQAPAHQQAQAELARRQALVQVAQSQRLPDMTVGLGLKRLEEEGRNRAIVEFSLPLPLFDQNRGNILQALRQSDAAQAQLQAAELQWQGAVRQAHADLALALEQARTLHITILPVAEQNYRDMARGVGRGKFALDELLDAQRTLLDARLRQLTTLANAHRTHAELMRLTGSRRLLYPEPSP